MWQEREGLLVRLEDETGSIGWGEVAPLPDFGSETLTDAIAFCRQQGGAISSSQIATIPDTLPCCQFAFESAVEAIADPNPPPTHLAYSYLLPAGENALQRWRSAWERGGRTFKWKIGIETCDRELQLLDRFLAVLPATARLRLDANGGLSLTDAKRWLAACDRDERVEFLEQPLPPAELADMQQLRQHYATAIALDESVATFPQLVQCYRRGWRGIFIVKGAISGFPSRLQAWVRETEIEAIFSSAMEGAIARRAVLKLAARLSSGRYAVGFGVDDWFA